WRYGFLVCDDTTPAADQRTPKSVFAFHALKGASEQGFSHLLSDLDLQLSAAALLAMFFGEPGMEKMRVLFHKAAEADHPALISAVN
ncbi:MAG: hypothetical protein IH623_27460, partial [Verrucomicrobia bacterium]|nr:hypothetical protein [Verrucomicrobiota bacterium]